MSREQLDLVKEEYFKWRETLMANAQARGYFIQPDGGMEPAFIRGIQRDEYDEIMQMTLLEWGVYMQSGARRLASHNPEFQTEIKQHLSEQASGEQKRGTEYGGNPMMDRFDNVSYDYYCRNMMTERDWKINKGLLESLNPVLGRAPSEQEDDPRSKMIKEFLERGVVIPAISNLCGLFKTSAMAAQDVADWARENGHLNDIQVEMLKNGKGAKDVINAGESAHTL